MKTAQALQPTSKVGDHFVFEGERLVDKVTARYYVPERWLIECVNKKLERAANMAMEHREDALATRIRTLKERL